MTQSQINVFFFLFNNWMIQELHLKINLNNLNILLIRLNHMYRYETNYIKRINNNFTKLIITK